MSYPILTATDAQTIGEILESKRGLSTITANLMDESYDGLDRLIGSRGGASWNESAFKTAAKLFIRQLSEDRKNGDLTRLSAEEQFAAHILEQSKYVEDSALQDPDFWRYLTFFTYRYYVAFREGDLKPSRAGGGGDKLLVRWTLLRGYLWGAHLSIDGDHSYITKYKDCRRQYGLGDTWVPDFYINNAVRRSWSFNPMAARAFVDAITSAPPVFDTSKEDRPTQELGSRVGRLSENIYFHALDQDQLTDLFKVEKTDLDLVLYESDLEVEEE